MKKKEEKYSSFLPLNDFFNSPWHTPKVSNFIGLILSELSHSQSPHHSRTFHQNYETKQETYFLLCQSLWNQTHFRPKGQNLVFFMDLKQFDKKNNIKEHIFFGLCNKIRKNNLKILEPHFVQCCVTKIDADACKA